VYEQNIEEKVKGPPGGGASAPAPEREALLDKYMIMMFKTTHPTASGTAKSSTQLVRSTRGGDFNNRSKDLRAQASNICYEAVAADKAKAKAGNPAVAATTTTPLPAADDPWRQYRTMDGRPLPPIPRRGIPMTDEEKRAADTKMAAAAAQEMWERLQPSFVADEMMRQLNLTSETPMEMSPEARASLTASSTTPPRRRRTTSSSSSSTSSPYDSRRVRPRGDGSRQ